VKKEKLHLNFYLSLNLVISGILLIGLWRGASVLDSTVRLPNLLLVIVLINSILIFRESFFPGRKGSVRLLPLTGTDNLRKVLHNRKSIDECLLQDALTAVLSETGDDGMLLLTFEEGGFFSLVASVGKIPPQLSAARFMLNEAELRAKHPGGLGEECICQSIVGKNLLPFRSQIVQIRANIVPLHLFGKCRGLWFLVPGDFRKVSSDRLGHFSLFLENVLALSLIHSKSAEGHQMDLTTGLLKFEAFTKAFETEIERSERYGQKMTLMLVGIPNFDETTVSHREILQKAVASGLRSSLRRVDLSFSWRKPGVFAAVLTETDVEVAKMVAERVASSFQKHLSEAKAEGKINFGYATYPDDATFGDGLIEKAEEALEYSIREKIGIVSFSRVQAC